MVSRKCRKTSLDRDRSRHDNTQIICNVVRENYVARAYYVDEGRDALCAQLRGNPITNVMFACVFSDIALMRFVDRVNA